MREKYDEEQEIENDLENHPVEDECRGLIEADNSNDNEDPVDHGDQVDDVVKFVAVN